MLITERAKRKINTLLDSTNDCINYPKTNKDGYGDIQEIVEGKKLHSSRFHKYYKHNNY